MTEIPYDIGTSTNKYGHVRVKATGEIGRLAYSRSSGFFMETVLGNDRATYVQFEETGEFRMYSYTALELIDS